MIETKYEKELRRYLEAYHPDLENNREFIKSRSALAAETFIECSQAGMRIDESESEANEVLYKGLHFSLYELVSDIIDEYDLQFKDIEKLKIHMYQMCKPLSEQYDIADDSGTSNEELYTKIHDKINQYLIDYELQ